MKEKIRQEYLKKRKALSAKEVEDKSRAIADNFMGSAEFKATTFHVFLPLKKFNEVNTYNIIHKLWELNKQVVVPKMEGKKLLNCHFTPSTLLEKNKWDIEEPKDCILINNQKIDVVIMPLLICDKNGNRIGYGGGFYDRFLPNLKKECKLIGVNFFEPIDRIPSENHDIPLEALVTPAGLIYF